jgi:hypothetical protein
MQGKKLLWAAMLAAALTPLAAVAQHAVAQPDEIVKKADWQAMQTVTVISTSTAIHLRISDLSPARPTSWS